MQLAAFVQQGLHEAVGEVTEKRGIGLLGGWVVGGESCRPGAILSNPVSPAFIPFIYQVVLHITLLLFKLAVNFDK